MSSCLVQFEVATLIYCGVEGCCQGRAEAEAEGEGVTQGTSLLKGYSPAGISPEPEHFTGPSID